ncbi:sodA [Symbiodinium sp. KB8]|nr:sodA [Symbiodinium sp. KB8]
MIRRLSELTDDEIEALCAECGIETSDVDSALVGDDKIKALSQKEKILELFKTTEMKSSLEQSPLLSSLVKARQAGVVKGIGCEMEREVPMSLSVSLDDEQKADYARALGVEPEREVLLFDVVQRMLAFPLPEPWRQCLDDQWRVYFYNERTKIPSWSHPLLRAHHAIIKAYRWMVRLPASTRLRLARRLRV